MKSVFSLVIIALLSFPVFAQLSDDKFDVLINKCSGISNDGYKCTTYIDLAVYVQSLEKDVATGIIKKYAETSKYEDQIIILTKMLLVPANNDSLRRPYIGGALFFGKTTYDDWQSEPIEIIDNIPFLIVGGYFLGGLAESASDYFEYCLKNGQWTGNIYKTKTPEEYQNALNLLLKSDKWNKELSEYEKKFFVRQI